MLLLIIILIDSHHRRTVKANKKSEVLDLGFLVETERIKKGKPFSFASQISYYMSVLLRLRQTVAHGQ